MSQIIKSEDSDPTQDRNIVVDEQTETVTASSSTYETGISTLSVPSSADIVNTSVDAKPINETNSASLDVHSESDGGSVSVDIANNSGAEHGYKITIRVTYLI